MKKFLLKLLGKWALPALKEKAISYIDSNELQKKYVDLLNKKLDIPQLSEEVEEKLLNAAYDAAQELAKENIKKLDVDKLIDSI